MIEDRIDVNIAGGLDIPLPKMVTVQQKFESPKVGDIPTVIEQEFARPEIRAKVKPGQVIAVGCGSRGIANIATIAKSVIDGLKALGAEPFIFPCMGSHGAATAEGQKEPSRPRDCALTRSLVIRPRGNLPLHWIIPHIILFDYS